MTESVSASPPVFRFALFDYGFRPFFLLAGLYAFAIVPVWLYFFAHHAVSFGALPAVYWHAHEMLYGFAGAAIGGFLLTAVPSWTASRGFAGRPLMLAVTAWFAGRLAMATVGLVPFWATALAELAFLPMLAVLLVPPLTRAMNRNTRLLAVLGVLWSIDAIFLTALHHGKASVASHTMLIAIDLVAVLVTVIGGRIVPAFTANALRRRGQTVTVRTRGWLEKATVASMIGVVLCDLFAPVSFGTGILAAIAALLHALRLSGWRSFRARSESIVWILHVGYAWLPIGLALKACFLLGDIAWAAKWQHAIAAGAFATMILAVMTRASLGHTGRPLAVSKPITAAYVLLTLAVIVRVFATTLWPERYLLWVSIAGLFWFVCFALFLIVYAPILIGPRPDGKPG